MKLKVAEFSAKIWQAPCLAGVFFLCSTLMPAIENSAQADVFGDALGVATDPLKLGAASQNILDAVQSLQLMLNQISAVETTTNQNLADRISQVKAIVDEVVDAINNNVANLQQIISQAETKIADLENQIYLDAESLLNQAQCVAQNIATVQVQELIANAVSDLRAAHAGIKILGFRIVSLSLKQIKVTDPDMAYISVRDAYLKRLNSLKETDSAYIIVSTYGNIEKLAKEASCAYSDPTMVAMFLKEEFTYSRMAEAWSSVPVNMQD